MDQGTITQVISSLRDPVDAKRRIHFTQRSILFLNKLFEGKKIDTIDLHDILLRLASASGCFISDDKHFISLKQIVTYLYIKMPPCITSPDIVKIANTFDIQSDNDQNEVLDMKTIVYSINS